MTKDRSEYPEDAQQELTLVWFEIEIIEPRVADQRLKINACQIVTRQLPVGQAKVQIARYSALNAAAIAKSPE